MHLNTWSEYSMNLCFDFVNLYQQNCCQSLIYYNAKFEQFVKVCLSVLHVITLNLAVVIVTQ